jgi:putative hemin transport protein
MKTDEPTLKSRWEEFRLLNPKTRIRDAAQELGVSEAELLATRAGEDVTKLEGDWTELIKSLPKLGRVMCLTRNEAAVHERFGEFRHIDFFHGMGQVVGPDIDLRLFLNHWTTGFAVTDQTKEGGRQSLQFFDAHGDAIHKVFLQKESDYGSYGVILNQFRASDQSRRISVTPAPAPRAPLPDAEIDLGGFRDAWLALRDTHGFFPLLQKFRVAREQALRLAPEGHASPVPVDSVRRMLEGAAANGLPIMVFVGSRG